ncbi:MAG: class I SAM-dependent methyltransferase [Phycisphaerales bacterium]|nr:class I SAM-dependent methyltransferase [Phycisphaerales bacterium]
MSGIEDAFDRVADGYASFRPHYPETLFDQVAACCTSRDLAWEIGCGSGQATTGLASRFKRVEATDPAPSAIEKASNCPGVRFSVGRAESSPLAAETVDLIASAQAAHWFDMTAFAREARRVGNQNAIVALWCYDRCLIEPSIDAVTSHLYKDILKGYWDPRRSHVDAGYTTLPFPFTEIDINPPNIVLEWTLDHLLGYLGTWSAAEAYRKRTGEKPIALIEADLREAWGDPATTRTTICPVSMRLGHVHG